MNLAILDVGSNNIKLEIHRVDPKGNNELIYADKIAARLGHEVFLTQRLSEENIELALNGIEKFSKMAKQMQCKKTIVLGTAALREAQSDEFVRRVKKECGVSISIISGIEEARLVYLGALSELPFKNRTFFLNDIGGGSTEISVSNSSEILFVESLRLGTVRLKELFEINPMNEKKNKKMKRTNFELLEGYVNRVFQPFSKQIKGLKCDMGICTGGTSRNLMEIIQENSLDTTEEEGGIPILKTRVLKELLEEMKLMSPEDLEDMDGLDKQRVDIIIPGAILLLNMLTEIGIEHSFILSSGLRDGAITDYIHKNLNKSIYIEKQESSRELGLRKLSGRFNLEEEHAEQCAKLSLQIFDKLKEEHRMGDQYRDILWGGALLHDIGSYISYISHHKHSEYLVSNSELFGFSEKEKNWIALITRYHRKGRPKSSHAAYQNLPSDEKDMILKLSAIVRIADSLDRSYQSAVSSIQVQEIKKDCIQFEISGKNDLSLELWSVERKKDYFEKVFQKRLEIWKV